MQENQQSSSNHIDSLYSQPEKQASIQSARLHQQSQPSLQYGDARAAHDPRHPQPSHVAYRSIDVPSSREEMGPDEQNSTGQQTTMQYVRQTLQLVRQEADETPKFISDTSSFRVSLYHQSSDQIISRHTKNESCDDDMMF